MRRDVTSCVLFPPRRSGEGGTAIQVSFDSNHASSTCTYQGPAWLQWQVEVDLHWCRLAGWLGRSSPWSRSAWGGAWALTGWWGWVGIQCHIRFPGEQSWSLESQAWGWTCQTPRWRQWWRVSRPCVCKHHGSRETHWAHNPFYTPWKIHLEM